MKKLTGVCVTMCLMMLLSGCGNQNMVKELADKNSSRQDTAEKEASSEASSQEEPLEELDAADAVDLTVLNSTMVYSEVYDMVEKPENYIGKTIRMKGNFSVYEENDRRYFACIIQDATACCAQGLEFELKGTHQYPEDYPAMNAEITVTGIFDTYEEDGDRYCVIKNAVLS